MAKKEPVPVRLENGQSVKRAAVYARISGMGDERTASLETQAEGAVEMARQAGYVVDHEDIIHERFTGAELYDRPRLTELREKVKAGLYQGVFCHALDRLSRDPVHQLILAEEFARAGCELQYVTEIVDGSPESQLIQFVKGYAAKLEREKIKERTMRGRRRVLDQGQLLCAGTPKYGYVYDRERRCRVIDPEAAKWVLQVFRWIGEEGESSRSVARMLNDAGVPSPFAHHELSFKSGRSVLWGPTQVRRLIRDETYTGKTLVCRQKSIGRYKNGRQRKANVDPSEWRRMEDSLTPPIVTEELFLLANKSLENHNSSTDRTRNQKHHCLLRGMVYCGVCGRRMYPETAHGGKRRAGRGYLIFRCRSRRSPTMEKSKCGGGQIVASWIEEEVWQRVHALINDPDVRASQLAQIEKGDPSRPLKDALEAAERELEKGLRVEKRLCEAWLNEEDATFADRLQADHVAARNRIKDLRATVTDIENKLAASDSEIDSRRLEEECEKLAGRLMTDIPFEDKRHACEAFGITVTRNGRDVKITADVGVPSTTSGRVEPPEERPRGQGLRRFGTGSDPSHPSSGASRWAT